MSKQRWSIHHGMTVPETEPMAAYRPGGVFSVPPGDIHFLPEAPPQPTLAGLLGAVRDALQPAETVDVDVCLNQFGRPVGADEVIAASVSIAVHRPKGEVVPFPIAVRKVEQARSETE